MNIRAIYIGLLLLGIVSCAKEAVNDGCAISDKPIEIEVTDPSTSTRVDTLNSYDDILAEDGFTLDAYLDSNDRPYFSDSWVYFFNGNWRFRDVVNTGNLIDFYWPNDDNVNFIAFIPRDDTNSPVKRQNIRYSAREGMVFNCALPSVINDRTDAEREMENLKSEFVYASCLDKGKDDGSVKLHFVHPFAVVNFRLYQSHRDLTLHSITISCLSNSGTYRNTNDTYETYPNGQDALTYAHWSSASSNDSVTINLEKSVPEDINYTSHIGGPYLVIPQVLSDGAKDVKLSVNYSWDTNIGVNSTPKSISTVSVPAWQPGKRYTYFLDLGDNKEEIIFKVLVEAWEKGEDDDYENNYDVK